MKSVATALAALVIAGSLATAAPAVTAGSVSLNGGGASGCCKDAL
ncbi:MULTISPECIES: hypothetical protein [Cellulomonas]|nr:MULTISPECIES: hypothetical protein [Cellulomonas]